MSNSKSQLLTLTAMLISALGANFLIPGMRGLLGWGAYAVVCLLTLLTATSCRLLSAKPLFPPSQIDHKRHSMSERIGIALVMACAFLCYYFAQIVLSYIVKSFDMFQLGGTRDYMAVDPIIAVLIFAILPSLCRQMMLLSIKDSFSEGQSILFAALFYAGFCFSDGVIGWAFIGGFAMWLINKTHGIGYSALLDAMTGTIMIALVKLNDVLALATGDSLDFSFAGGMNMMLVFGMGFIITDCAVLALVFGKGKLGGRKLTKIEFALLLTLAFAGFCIGCGLTSMGNHTHL